MNPEARRARKGAIQLPALETAGTPRPRRRGRPVLRIALAPAATAGRKRDVSDAHRAREAFLGRATVEE